jgi:hypothetical protein
VPPLATIIILGLVAYRLARLVATDSISEDMRAALYRWAWNDEPSDDAERMRPLSEPVPRGRVRPYVYELISCAFCIGVWTGAGAFVLWGMVIGSLAGWFIAIPAIAGVQALAQCLDGAADKVSE